MDISACKYKADNHDDNLSKCFDDDNTNDRCSR